MTRPIAVGKKPDEKEISVLWIRAGPKLAKYPDLLGFLLFACREHWTKSAPSGRFAGS
jgi:hypothetical protein